MHTNRQEEEEDDCPICNENLPQMISKIVRMTCCGKGMHIKCRDDMYASSSMSYKQKCQCIMCRTEKPAAGSAGIEERVKRVRRWVERGKAWAQSSLGEMYYQGDGVDQSYQRARELWELAAKQGVAHAQCNLGALYANGQGGEQSFETARELWMKSAEKGNENAILGLQQIDKHEGRITPSFTPPKRCSTCDTPKTSTHKLKNCKCKGAQYCNATCQKSHWKSHKKEHSRLCKEMAVTNTEGEMKDEVVVEEEEGEQKEVATADSQQQVEEEDVCPVCIEPLQKDPNKFVRFTCCGKGIHKWCNEGIKASSLSDEQKITCPLCRTKYPTAGEELTEHVRPWVEKGKAWAQLMLGDRYRHGVGVDQSYQQAREQ